MSIQRSKIQSILPIILAIVLPGIGMYSNAQAHEMTNGELVFGWAVTSTIFYALWLIFGRIWNLESRSQRLSAFVVMMLFMVMLPHLVTLFTDHELPETNILASVRVFMAMILMMAMQFAMHSQNNITKLQLEKEQLLSENLKVQLTALQNKVDPHFLFNSMNTLLAMVKRGNEQSEQFIISLSDFYRQTLQNNDNPTVAISKELQVLESYLFLMKSRNEHGVSIEMNIPQEILPKHLPTLALQIVLENCFKHNSMSTNNPLSIRIDTDIHNNITVSNNIQPKFGNVEKSGFGLDLLKKRYALLGVKDAVKVLTTEETFTVKLKMIAP